MLSNSIITYIQEQLECSVKNQTPLTGGDINNVYCLQTDKKPLVVKVNTPEFYNMLKTEEKGLKLLQSTNTFTIPETYGAFKTQNHAFLVLEYISNGKPTTDFWKNFAQQLALLHKNSNSYFGLDHNNYIGTLPQYNNYEHDAADFYINWRLEPQIKLAESKGYSFKKIETFYSKIATIIPKEKPALLHGDLWNGNYIVTQNGAPCLIDPAVSYGSREQDLAMMLLFGGFPDTLFNYYNEIYPLTHNWKERVPIWQLYYILVHVNLFGGSYYQSALNIINKFS